jgi:hypothetical protein
MPDSENRLNREIVLYRRLEQWLPTIASEAEADAVRVHLGDLYGASEKLMALISRLPDMRATVDRHEIRALLAHIHVELYSHMLPHIEELRAGLEVWLQRLNDEIPDEEE